MLRRAPEMLLRSIIFQENTTQSCFLAIGTPGGAIHTDLSPAQNAPAHRQPHIWWADSRRCREPTAAIGPLARYLVGRFTPLSGTDRGDRTTRADRVQMEI